MCPHPSPNPKKRDKTKYFFKKTEKKKQKQTPAKHKCIDIRVVCIILPLHEKKNRKETMQCIMSTHSPDPIGLVLLKKNNHSFIALLIFLLRFEMHEMSIFILFVTFGNYQL